MPQKDFLDELIEEGTRRNPAFPAMVDAAYQRRLLFRELRTKRIATGLTQSDVAGRMDASRYEVARLERGELNATLSTIDRYATAIGHRVEWRVKES